jgi:hypothetical protein
MVKNGENWLWLGQLFFIKKADVNNNVTNQGQQTLLVTIRTYLSCKGNVLKRAQYPNERKSKLFEDSKLLHLYSNPTFAATRRTFYWKQRRRYLFLSHYRGRISLRPRAFVMHLMH